MRRAHLAEHPLAMNIAHDAQTSRVRPSTRLLWSAALAGGLLFGLLPAAGAADIEQGRVKAEAVCAACHGKDGNTPVDPSYPRLAGQYQDYLVQSMLEYKRDARKNPIMGAQAKLLSRQEIDNLAAYYASLPGSLLPR